MGCGSSQVAGLEKTKTKDDEEDISTDDETVVEKPVEKRRKSHDKTKKHKAAEVVEEVSTEDDEDEDEEKDEDEEEVDQVKKVLHKKRTSSGKSNGGKESRGSRKGSGSSSGKKRSKVEDENNTAEEYEEESDVDEGISRRKSSSKHSSRASSGTKSSRSSKSSAKDRRKFSREVEAEIGGTELRDGIPNKEEGSTLDNSVDEDDEGIDDNDDRSHSARSKDSGFADEDDEDCVDVKFISDESPAVDQEVAKNLDRPPTPDLALCGKKIESTQNEMLQKQKTKKKRAREEKELMQMCLSNARDLPPIGISRPKSRGGGLAFQIELPEDGPVLRPKTPSGPKGEIRLPAGLENRLKRQDRSHAKKKPKDITDIQKKLIAAERRKQKQERQRLNRIESMDKTVEVESTQKMRTIKARQTETRLENKLSKVEQNREQLIAERKAKLVAQQAKMAEVKRRKAEVKAREKAELHGEEFLDQKHGRGVTTI